MAKYERTYDYGNVDENGDEIIENNDTSNDTPVIPQNDGTDSWQKRYGDLRSHASREKAALEKRIRELESGGSNNSEPEYPKNEAEVAAWMKKVPDVAAIITTMIRKELAGTRSELNEFKTESAAEKEKREKNEAKAQLADAHPDFFKTIVNDPDFHKWIETKSQWVYEALYVNELDWRRAAEAIDLYKLETGKKSSKETRRSAAEDIRTPNNPNPGNDGETWFSESQIERMSAAEYERNEEAIDKARAQGRIKYDLSGAAR